MEMTLPQYLIDGLNTHITVNGLSETPAELAETILVQWCQRRSITLDIPE